MTRWPNERCSRCGKREMGYEWRGAPCVCHVTDSRPNYTPAEGAAFEAARREHRR
jgi:hypothetical protein